MTTALRSTLDGCNPNVLHVHVRIKEHLLVAFRMIYHLLSLRFERPCTAVVSTHKAAEGPVWRLRRGLLYVQ